MMELQNVKFVHIDVKPVKKKPVNASNVKILDQIPQLVTVQNYFMMTILTIQYVNHVITHVKPVKQNLKIVLYVFQTEYNYQIVFVLLDSMNMNKKLPVLLVTKNVKLAIPTQIVQSVPYTELMVPNLIAHAQMENIKNQMELVEIVI